MHPIFVFSIQFNTYKTVKSRAQLHTMKMLKCADHYNFFVFLIRLMMTSGIYFYI
jgi:hypothetical protein